MANQKPIIARTEDEIFPEIGQKFHMWKKGEISNPSWLNRQNGSDFITIATERNLSDLEKYLSRIDKRLAAEIYNGYSTGYDKVGNRLIGLYDMAHDESYRKLAMICIVSKAMTMRVLEIVEEHCAEMAP